MFTNLNLTDMESCYKAFRREIIQKIHIEENRFGFEPEITAKVAKTGCRVYEVGISYAAVHIPKERKLGGGMGWPRSSASLSSTFCVEIIFCLGLTL